MSSFEEVYKVLETLWEEELDELERIEAEAKQNIDNAHSEVTRLQGMIEDTGQRIAFLRSEQEEQLPKRLMKATLAQDQKGQQQVQTRFSDVTKELEGLEQSLEAARQELEELTSEAGDTEAYLRKVERANEVRPKRFEWGKKRDKELRSLDRLLEDRHDIATLGYSQREEEARAAAQRQSADISLSKRFQQDSAKVVSQMVEQNPQILTREDPEASTYRKTLEDAGLLEQTQEIITRFQNAPPETRGLIGEVERYDLPNGVPSGR